ncbi:hypothetical protein [Roseivirga sp. E12]|uniref:hypothetical protein n=1 Tax=Roseivirga sp. E12 TaxID=2819237 RepID=UPI001ABBEE36|nr:hypothetical protein [Roseivirga sp. E12]MBO3699956.1 hypothetical protein [Roseivirga sp. E12]
MPEKKKKPIGSPKAEKAVKAEKTKDSDFSDQDDFDFGGFPKDVSLKKNIGCGG